MADKCELCGSENDVLNFHHLIPRTLHSNKYFKKNFDHDYLVSHGVLICRHFCHSQIHKFISEKDMGKEYNTLELLLNHPDVKKYVEWRKKHL